MLSTFMVVSLSIVVPTLEGLLKFFKDNINSLIDQRFLLSLEDAMTLKGMYLTIIAIYRRIK